MRVFPRFICLWMLVLAQLVWAEDEDLRQISDRAGLFRNVIQNHPGAILRNLPYGGMASPEKVLSQVPDLMDRLGNDRNSFHEPNQRYLGLTYSPDGNGSFDPARLADLQASLKADLGGLGITQLQGLDADLQSIRAASLVDGQPNQAQQRARVLSLMRLFPFLYDSSGRPKITSVEGTNRTSMEGQIDAMKFSDLPFVYSSDAMEKFRETVQKIPSGTPGAGLAKDLWNNVERTYRRDTLPKTLAFYPPDGNKKTVESRSVSLTGMDPIEALFRAFYGKDCALMSLPFFSLAKNARSYKISTSLGPNAEGEGYVYVVPVQEGGRTIPYVLGMNGLHLTEGDTRKILQLVGRDLGTRELVVPDFERNFYLVNYDGIRSGMTFEGSRKTTVSFPKGWEKLIRTGMPSPETGRSWYDPIDVGHAKVIQLPEDPSIVGGIDVRTLPSPAPADDPNKLPVLERALVAAQMVSSNPASREQVLQEMGVTRSQLAAAQPLLEPRVLSLNEFLRARDVIGFKLENVLDLPYQGHGHTLGALYGQRPDLATPAEWARLAARNDAILVKLNEPFTRSDGHGMQGQMAQVMRVKIYEQRLALPPEGGHVTRALSAVLMGNDPIHKPALLAALGNVGWPSWLPQNPVPLAPRAPAVAAEPQAQEEAPAPEPETKPTRLANLISLVRRCLQ